MPCTVIMAGGGTGGHVIPALSVARELAQRGHTPIFIGTHTGFEAKLIPPSGFTLEYIQIGGLKRVGAAQSLRTVRQLPQSVFDVLRLLQRYGPSAVFSMGGYVAGPVVVAGLLRRLPLVVMEPNAMPGFTNRRAGRFVARALLSFQEAARFFPAGRAEVTGVPIREEFFRIAPKPHDTVLTVLITGGSQGSRTLNEAVRGSWARFQNAGFQVRLLHQTGVAAYQAISHEFMQTGLRGEVLPFFDDMPAAFAQADLIVCRAGASAVAEVSAAGKPSILVPFPGAADQHQLRNAQALERAGAAALVLDSDMHGERLFKEVENLAADPQRLDRMGERARSFAHPGAARRAAEVLEEVCHARA
ncbi:MAG: undecaprenyldiphospho-muramoylpentapeptide beta-N-acetylglucosaminyltransferase [Acidobacteriota bacterium]|nr:undecaprenyldiphospho-muramoylpentapeptide beta-N-acetylglucosaminyltransferase [Acidobacteriota bacterium]